MAEPDNYNPDALDLQCEDITINNVAYIVDSNGLSNTDAVNDSTDSKGNYRASWSNTGKESVSLTVRKKKGSDATPSVGQTFTMSGKTFKIMKRPTMSGSNNGERTYTIEADEVKATVV